MSSQNLTYQDLLQIVEWIKSSAQFGEFHLKMGDTEVYLRRHTTPASTSPGLDRLPQPQSQVEEQERGEEETLPGRLVASPDAAHGGSPAYPAHTVLITSPMVGTFYRAPEPGAPPFVEVGQQVEPDTTVCIIEVMKLMHSMPARHHGVVTHILVQDATPVEYGQALLVLDPQVGTTSPAPTAGAAALR